MNASTTSDDGAGARVRPGCWPFRPRSMAIMKGGSAGTSALRSGGGDSAPEYSDRGDDSTEEVGDESDELSERTLIPAPSEPWWRAGEAAENSPIPAALMPATMKRYEWPADRLPTRAHGSGESVLSMPICQG
eukprot:scaffold7039_cov118-Isochrysis_galbana.AAC.4